VGQRIQTNFIRNFSPGPPLKTLCNEVWLDTQSQDLATLNQLKAFTEYSRDRGFPLRVDAIDDEKKEVQLTLLETGLNSIFKEWKIGETHDFSAAATTLRIWEPNGGQSVPDRMFNVKLTAIEELPIGYGSGGAKMTFTVPILYEAYLKGTIINLYPGGRSVTTLPIEERLPKEFDQFLIRSSTKSQKQVECSYVQVQSIFESFPCYSRCLLDFLFRMLGGGNIE